ncbi:MAG: hypothetical protein CMP21_03725 [Rickettsiales bacterium]|nr:hypothetical protein [Rickettsiales bacterium]|tara:strand:+ start:4462 stop:5670 length:1209 start_codon:yes stop_codon:yes gene_type:complete
MTTNQNSENTTWEWSGDFEEEGQEIYILENEADNLDQYNFENVGKVALESLNFKSEINLKYNPPQQSTGSGSQGGTGGTSTTSSETSFTPIFSTVKTEVIFSGIEIKSSEVNVTNIDKFETIDVVGKSVNILLKTYIKPNEDDPNDSRSEGLNFLSEYVDKFKLPDNFTFDKYDTEDGYYKSGHSLITAGGNFHQIQDQGNSHEVDVVVNITFYDKDPSTNEDFEEMTISRTFKITVRRNYSSIRNLFITKYLDEQILRGDVEYFTFNGIKFYDGISYLRHLGEFENGVPKNLKVTKIIGVNLKSINGSLLNITKEVEDNDGKVVRVVEKGTYFESDDFSSDTYSSGYLQNLNQENENITLYLKNVLGNINTNDIIKSDGLTFLVTNVFSATVNEPYFNLAF